MKNFALIGASRIYCIGYNDIPQSVKEKDVRTFRSITVEGNEVEFSEGFTDLHTRSYEHVIGGTGFGLSDAENAIQIASDIRHATLIEKSSSLILSLI